MEELHCSINALNHVKFLSVKWGSLSDFTYHLHDTLWEFLKVHIK